MKSVFVFVHFVLCPLNVIAYDKQIKKLYLVPVNPISGSNYNVELIKNTINQIYAQAVVQWDVQPHEALISDSWDENGDGIFDDTDKDDHMDYTPDMKSLRKAFRKQFTEEKDAVYVFLISGVHKTNLTGYMPLKGQYGFIFIQNQSETETAHTIAHEIGHGAFHLRHTFSPKNKYVLSQNTTDNLMDYTPDGKALNKYQWDQIPGKPAYQIKFIQSTSPLRLSPYPGNSFLTEVALPTTRLSWSRNILNYPMAKPYCL
jgi:hypothetical protein